MLGLKYLFDSMRQWCRCIFISNCCSYPYEIEYSDIDQSGYSTPSIATDNKKSPFFI